MRRPEHSGAHVIWRDRRPSGGRGTKGSEWQRSPAPNHAGYCSIRRGVCYVHSDVASFCFGACRRIRSSALGAALLPVRAWPLHGPGPADHDDDIDHWLHRRGPCRGRDGGWGGRGTAGGGREGASPRPSPPPISILARLQSGQPPPLSPSAAVLNSIVLSIIHRPHHGSELFVACVIPSPPNRILYSRQPAFITNSDTAVPSLDTTARIL